MGHTDYSVDYKCSEIGYCGHPNLPYTNIQFEKASDLILSHFQEEYHSLINDTLKNKKTQLVSLYFVYKPKKNASRTDITNYDQNAYKYCPTYGDESTSYHRHMTSIVVFSKYIYLKLCWWIMQLQRWVALTIIRMLPHVPKYEGKWY